MLSVGQQPTTTSSFFESIMNKEIILLKTVKSFCEIAVGEQELYLKYEATGSPDKLINHPLFESARDVLHSSLRKGIAPILAKENLALPERMTHSDLVDKLIDTQVIDQIIIVEPLDLMRIYNLLDDLIRYDVNSSCFQTVLTFNNVN